MKGANWLFFTSSSSKQEVKDKERILGCACPNQRHCNNFTTRGFVTYFHKSQATIEIPVSVHISTDFIKTISAPSPTATVLIPISIAPCPPVSIGASRPSPIFTDSTTTSTTTIEPLVSINATDAGAGASIFTTVHSTPPISFLRHNNPNMIFGDDDDFAGFTCSPFNIRTKSDDEALVTRGQLKEIHEKLEFLLHATKISSIDDYSQATVKSILETLTKEYSANLEKMNKVVDASTIVCNNTTEKFDKLITDAQVFIEKFKRSFESNIAKANEVISSVGSTLKTKKIQDDLAMERKIMDVLSIKIEKVKVLTVKIVNAEKQVNDLLFEKAAMKSYIVDITGMLSYIIETRDSMITIMVKNNVAERNHGFTNGIKHFIYFA
ncbi:unnamed protein product [Lactuca saligna]|uniref:Uncharacterized protein n=1 Tax=Lactuca saligna TaxID=75948 RepID=A0AA35UYN9_LACSI|nr:unnamed protein product [Lactuca saligna]